MGAPYIDYVMADETLIPRDLLPQWSEKVIYLPDCYQANDRLRPIANQDHSRAELGLPADGFVFCCFNAKFKITPQTFDSWMRILSKVDGSVLWLLDDYPPAVRNLRRAAETRGVQGARLIFAKRLPLPEHLARQRTADLFLDTLPYNAHTTASDALWAGLPVLTLPGQSFAARVAASLLNAVGLPELVTRTPAEYEATAIGIATTAGRIRELKEKLWRNRLATPLFDSTVFARHVERAYEEIYERHRAGLAPDHFHVAPDRQTGALT